jgi:hypothetical protein
MRIEVGDVPVLVRQWLRENELLGIVTAEQEAGLVAWLQSAVGGNPDLYPTLWDAMFDGYSTMTRWDAPGAEPAQYRATVAYMVASELSRRSGAGQDLRFDWWGPLTVAEVMQVFDEQAIAGMGVEVGEENVVEPLMRRALQRFHPDYAPEDPTEDDDALPSGLTASIGEMGLRQVFGGESKK